MRLVLLTALTFATPFSSPSPAAGKAMVSRAEATVEAVLEVPLVVEDNRLLVPIEIEGIGKTFFILDTAASGHVISADLRSQLKLSPNDIREQTVQGSTGSTKMEFVKLPSTSVGGQRHRDQWAVVADIAEFRDYNGLHVTGILGTDLLAKFDVEIDVPSRRLRLHRRGPNVSGGAFDAVLPFESSSDTNFVQFKGAIRGAPVNVLLDTGARNGILNWKAARLAGVTPEAAELIDPQSASKGIGGQQVPQYRHTFSSICFEAHCLPARELRISDLSVFGVVGWADQAAMLIGVEWLKGCRILISYSTSELGVCSQPGALESHS